MLRRRVTARWILMLALTWPSLQMADPVDRQWRFTVLLDGKPVGHHHVDLTGRNGAIEYRSETRLTVKILFLTVFRYRHVDTESWRDDCLRSIDSSTDNDGKAESLRGSAGQTSFAVATNHGSNELSAPCVMTFAYWNPRILSATRLMNAQTGEYVPVRVDALGADEVEVKGVRVPATHYAITGDKLNIELWYAADARWVALATTTEGGGRLQYRLE